MNLWIFIGLMAAGAVFCMCFIAMVWSQYNDSSLLLRKINLLRNYVVLSRVWPIDDKFLSLHFSVFRHLFFGIASLLLIWFLNLRWLNTLLTWANLLYAVCKIPLQSARHKDWKDVGDVSKETVKPIKRACTLVFIYPFYIYIVLMFGYAFRP